MIKGDKKIIRGWVFYDWANSVYNLVISSAIFPIFYDAVTTKHYLAENGLSELPKGEVVMVDFFGMHLSNSVLFSYVLSASFLMVAILSPILSGIADYSGNKKRFLQFFCYFGSLSAMSMFFFDAAHLEWSMLSVFFASIGFWNSLVFYNAYLPEIAEPVDHDKISARGFTMGYFGSMILLIFCLVWTQMWDYPAKWCFIFVGIWWAGFSQITYRALPNNVFNRKPEKGILTKGFRELLAVLKEFKKTARLKRYLISFFFFNTGVQTVMLLATIFASKEIDWPENGGTTGLIIAILLIQILGAVGAFLMSRLSGFIGNIKTLMVSVFIWILICLGAYFIVHSPTEFYILAASVGLVMGGVQSVARSTYSKFLPETEDHASYFSFYDVTEKIGIVVGTFFFGYIEEVTGSIRMSVISITIFFILGFLLLFFIPKQEKLKMSDD
jgi:UMF1 family MFS transporter|tara:strand:+ start:52621 stop:53946 length:1326 start_codon:yes stop_codon:yes gene_type:complete